MLGTGKRCGSRKNRTQVQLLVGKKKKKSLDTTGMKLEMQFLEILGIFWSAVFSKTV